MKTTQETMSTLSREAMLEQLRSMSVRHGVDTERTMIHLRELVEILRYYPPLGEWWGERMDELLADCHVMLADLYEGPKKENV